MSENPDPTTQEHAVPAGSDWVPSPAADAYAPQGSAIPLPSAGAHLAPGVPFPTASAGYPGAGQPPPTDQIPPTSQIPPVDPGSAPPQGGTPTPPPWSSGGGYPPYPGWPPPAFGGPTPPAKPRKGFLAALATLGLVLAITAGVGLGHVAWPNSSSSSVVSDGPAAGSGGSQGSEGNGSSPFSPGSSGSGSGGSSSSGSGSGNTSAAGAPADIPGIAAKASPALVDINTNLSYQNGAAAGTGMVLTSNGEILTNNHVIEGATSIRVTDVGNGKTYQAHVVGYDRTGDIAVVQLSNASGLQTISTSSASAAVGEAVVGVGNAGGAGGTPSAAGGSITALDQSITASDVGGSNAENLSGLIEVNAGIQPGDSGGSLVNAQGQVIGMDTAASAGSQYQVASNAYAIPIQTALSVAHKIVAGQASSVIHIGPTGFLGLGVASSSNSGAGSFGGGADTGSSGATVSQVLSNSAAGQAGVVAGDTIVSVDGSSVNSPSDLSNLLEPKHPGDKVQLQWTDQSGQTHTASVTLGSGPPA
jgi:S1-C subfamily serine protease